MTNNATLVAGQVIKLQGELWRVDLVNESRARIIPLAKRHVKLDDGREFDAEKRGVNISPLSAVEIVTDIEDARDQLELAATEKELRVAKAALAREAKAAAIAASKPDVPSTPKPKIPSTGTRGAGWKAVGTAPPFKAGTLAAETMGVIITTPGLTTKDIVAAVKTEGAVAACVSRFAQAGYIERVG